MDKKVIMILVGFLFGLLLSVPVIYRNGVESDAIISALTDTLVKTKKEAVRSRFNENVCIEMLATCNTVAFDLMTELDLCVKGCGIKIFDLSLEPELESKDDSELTKHDACRGHYCWNL